MIELFDEFFADIHYQRLPISDSCCRFDEETLIAYFVSRRASHEKDP